MSSLEENNWEGKIKAYLYGRFNEWWDIYNAFKLGKSRNIPERDATYITSEIRRGKFVFVLEVDDIILDELEQDLMVYFNEYNVYIDGGKEFFKKEIIGLIFEYLDDNNIEYYKLTEEEISNLTRKLRYIIDFLIKIRDLKIINIQNTLYNFKNNFKEYCNNLRDYQIRIKRNSLIELDKNNRVYIELATGGGKSTIVYNIFRVYNSEVIIIFSPRKNINEQNVGDKYINIIGKDKYRIYNCSINKNFNKFYIKCIKDKKKIIIVACPQQSYSKVYEYINENKLNDILIWFDEAHNTIEKWVNKDNKELKFLLKDKKQIKKRIFTSASPDRRLVETYPLIFGKLYLEIEIRELMDQKWLCNILPYIYEMNINDVNISDYILSNFENYNSKYGLSFHNKQDNAYKLFKKHSKKYITNKTNIKPFLIVSNNYDDIKLDYKYNDIKEYERTENSIAYVVQKISMGYDFNKIDSIIFTDPKTSSQDIIQVIGRGLRPDGLGLNGRNFNKELKVILPVYTDINNENKTKYDNIIKVLEYLLFNVKLDYNKFTLNNKCYNKIVKENNNEITYDGKENIKMVFLNLINKKITKWKINDIINLLINNNIRNNRQYLEFREDYKNLLLPEDLYKDYREFTWEQVHPVGLYYSKEECKQVIKKIQNNVDLSDSYNIEEYLYNIDNKIPPMDLNKFYGEYII